MASEMASETAQRVVARAAESGFTGLMTFYAVMLGLWWTVPIMLLEPEGRRVVRAWLASEWRLLRFVWEGRLACP